MDDAVGAALLEAHPEEEDDNKQRLSKKLWVEMKKIGRIMVPAVVFRMTTFGVYIVTQSVIGHISSIDLAAYALVQSISMLFVNGIAIGMSGATETLCGQAFGARQYHMMGIYLQRSWIVTLVTMTILLPIMIFTTPIYELLGEGEDISVAAENISLWLIPVMYTFAFTFTIQMFLQAQMKNAIIGYISVACLVVHVFMSWLFVYKLSLGIPGAIGAMIISQWVLVFGEWVYIFGGWCKETWKGFSMLAFADLLPVVKLSISAGIMLCLEIWYTSILVLIAGYSDNAVVEISAFSICLSIKTWGLMIAIGLLSTASVRVSNELGRGNIEVAKFSIKVLVCISATLGVLSCVICVVYGRSFPYLFTSDVEVAEAVANLSVLLALTMLVSSFQTVFSGVAIGCGIQAKVAVVNLVSYYVVGVPIGCLLALVAKLGVKGVWIGLLSGLAVQVITLVILTWRIDWKGEVNKTEKRLGLLYHESPEESN